MSQSVVGKLNSIVADLGYAIEDVANGETSIVDFSNLLDFLEDTRVRLAAAQFEIVKAKENGSLEITLFNPTG